VRTWLAIPLLLLLLATLTSLEANAVRVYLRAQPVAKPGYTNPLIRIDVVVDPDGQPVQSGEIIVAYPDTGLKVLEVKPGGLWGSHPLVARNESGRGRVVLVAAKPGEAAREPGVALSILFEVVGDKSYTVRLLEARFADSDGDDLPVMLVNTSCTVTVTKTVATKTVTKTTTVTRRVTLTKTVTLPPVTVTSVRTSVTTVTLPAKTTTIVKSVTVTVPGGRSITVTITAFRLRTVTRTTTTTVSVGAGGKPATIVKTRTVVKTRIVERVPPWSYAMAAIAIISLAALAYLYLRTRMTPSPPR